jgi:glycerophosphoryl diester phosphodiesterase
VPHPRIIAHRCGGALAPENSLAGLHIAARLGCRGVEFDAMLAADGVAVLIHDETLERTTSGAGRVAALRVQDLAALDAGYCHHPAFAAERIPRLDQALATCAALGLWANVEIKPGADAEEATGCEVARIAAKWPGVLLSSFSVAALIAARGVAPELPRALLVETLHDEWRSAMTADAAGALHVAAGALDARSMAAIRAAGGDIRVAAYTVNRREEADRLFALGVAAVFTDRPDLWATEEM